MTINIELSDIENENIKPKLIVFGVGGAGCNAVNNMIESKLNGVDFIVANTDAQALEASKAECRLRLGSSVTGGLGAGSQPHIGQAAAEESLPDITDQVKGANMVFITAGMGGGTGTGAAPIIANAAREQGVLTVGVVTKPFSFEGTKRMNIAEQGIKSLAEAVDTLIVIPNQNLFRIANEQTTFSDAFAKADEVLSSGVSSITELMVNEGLINLDFADVNAIMKSMGNAMMGTGEASGERRAIDAAEAAISNPLLDDVSMRGAKGVLISITGNRDNLTLFEVDEAANRIRSEVDEATNIILGATFNDNMSDEMRVSVVATGIGEDEEWAVANTHEYVDTSLRSTNPTSQRLSQLEVNEEDIVAKVTKPSMEKEFDSNGKSQEISATINMVSETDLKVNNETVNKSEDKPKEDIEIRKISIGESANNPFAKINIPNLTDDNEAVIKDSENLENQETKIPDINEFPKITIEESKSKSENKEHGIKAQKNEIGFWDRLNNLGIGKKAGEIIPEEAISSDNIDKNINLSKIEIKKDKKFYKKENIYDDIYQNQSTDLNETELPSFLKKSAKR